MTATPAERITAMVARFVAGQPLAEFSREFQAFDAGFDPRTLPDQQRDIYWALYDLIRLTRADAAGKADARPAGRSNSLGEAALRDRLRHFRLRGAAVQQPS